MAQTPLTTATPYCSAAELFNRHDWRMVADLINDGDGPRPTYAATLNSAVLAAILMDASGELESACVAGERYTPTDLQAMLDDDRAGPGLLVAGAGLITALVAHLAFWRLCQRRMPLSGDPTKVPGAKQALDALEALRKGERIFPFQESADAGLPGTVDPSDPATNPVAVNRIGIQASRFFGGGAGGYGPNCGGW
jgi:hypothetical protein